MKFQISKINRKSSNSYALVKLPDHTKLMNRWLMKLVKLMQQLVHYAKFSSRWQKKRSSLYHHLLSKLLEQSINPSMAGSTRRVMEHLILAKAQLNQLPRRQTRNARKKTQ